MMKPMRAWLCSFMLLCSWIGAAPAASQTATGAIPVSTERPAWLAEGTTLVYTGDDDFYEFRFEVTVEALAPSVRLSWTGSCVSCETPAPWSGSLTMTETALQDSRFQDYRFVAEAAVTELSTTFWFSEVCFKELTEKGHTALLQDDGFGVFSVALTRVDEQTLTIPVDGKATGLRVIHAKDSEGGTYWILNNLPAPLVIRFQEELFVNLQEITTQTGGAATTGATTTSAATSASTTPGGTKATLPAATPAADSPPPPGPLCQAFVRQAEAAGFISFEHGNNVTESMVFEVEGDRGPASDSGSRGDGVFIQQDIFARHGTQYRHNIESHLPRYRFRRHECHGEQLVLTSTITELEPVPEVYEPPLPVHRFPMEAGTKWYLPGSPESQGTEEPLGTWYEYGAVASITVPAGTFEAIPLQVTHRSEIGLSWTTSWYEVGRPDRLVLMQWQGETGGKWERRRVPYRASEQGPFPSWSDIEVSPPAASDKPAAPPKVAPQPPAPGARCLSWVRTLGSEKPLHFHADATASSKVGDRVVSLFLGPEEGAKGWFSEQTDYRVDGKELKSSWRYFQCEGEIVMWSESEDDDGFYLELNPPIPVHQFPMEPGRSWTYSGQVSSYDSSHPIQIDFQYGAVEKVTVPAGTFDAIPVTMSFLEDGLTSREVHWYEVGRPDRLLRSQISIDEKNMILERVPAPPKAD